jgi:hypothetical protein
MNDPTETFKQFKAYQFDKDEKYLSGLKSLQQPDSLQTRHFYYCKFIQSFDLNEFLNSQESKGKEPISEKLSFEQIMEMIKRGEDIPGIRQIPDTVYDSTKASTSSLKSIKKPWES